MSRLRKCRSRSTSCGGASGSGICKPCGEGTPSQDRLMPITRTRGSAVWGLASAVVSRVVDVEFDSSGSEALVLSSWSCCSKTVSNSDGSGVAATSNCLRQAPFAWEGCSAEHKLISEKETHLWGWLALPCAFFSRLALIWTVGSFLTLWNAATPYSCYLRGPVLQHMVEDYKCGVRDGQPVKHWTWRHTRRNLHILNDSHNFKIWTYERSTRGLTEKWEELLTPSEKCVEWYRMITNEINCLIWI